MTPHDPVSISAVPKIELHVHLEGTVEPATVLDIAARNGLALPVSTVDELSALYRVTTFSDFLRLWILTTNVLRKAEDFSQVVVDYARRAKRHGAVYIEGIFSPVERVMRGVGWAEIFDGYCEGAERAHAEHGVVVRLTPEAYRGADPELVAEMVRYAGRYRDRGVVGVGIGGDERARPARHYAAAFAPAVDLGLGVVPHAGEFPLFPDGASGAATLRETIEALDPVRIRHGIAAAADPALVALIRERGIVLDVCPTSNLRTGAIRGLADHPLPRLAAAGIPCTVGTDDPAVFDTDLSREFTIAARLGVEPRLLYDAGITGALCDDDVKSHLRQIGAATTWPTTTATWSTTAAGESL
ncbi:MAG: adenosine deaminase [Acidothermus cellulolyticus]|nr:adenosine deaminase [Acidothermus cellulolyticus]